MVPCFVRTDLRPDGPAPAAPALGLVDLIGMGPIGLDGFSQLFSQFNWPWLASILPYRESTPFLRVLTGGLFGFGTAWFAYPYIEESMNENAPVLHQEICHHANSQIMPFTENNGIRYYRLIFFRTRSYMAC